MKKLIKKFFFGATLPQEYLCLNLNEFKHSLRLEIIKSNGERIDITEQHLFNGYKPLIISIDARCFTNEIPDKQKSIHVTFRNDQNEEPAFLKLKFVEESIIDFSSILVFEGIKGVHNFKNSFNKLTSNFKYRLTANKVNDVYLEGNLFDQIKIAYAIPRKIFLVSVGTGNLFNVFPTDLSGTINGKIFVLSLRTGGKANEQIENLERCVISEMPAESFAQVYKAGKNHMKELTELENLGIKFRNERSFQLNIPVPLNANKYFELERVWKFQLGIHVLHFLKVLNSVQLKETNSVLAHLHGDYGAWRMRKGIKTNYLLRK